MIKRGTMFNGRGQPTFIPRKSEICQACGCKCLSCYRNDSLDLHHEIEVLRSKLKNGEVHVSQMEREFVESREYAETEISKLQDELIKLRDRYDRLFESHKQLQRVNHNLEDKLLKIVNKSEAEKLSLQKDVSSLTSKIVDAKVTIYDLEEENERYRKDCNLAVQMLHCRPSNYLAHKLNTLPQDLQERVKSHMTHEQIINLEDASNSQAQTKMIRVPMPTFPPTAMVYSVNKVPSHNAQSYSVLSNTDSVEGIETVSTSLIAKVLTQPEPKRKPRNIYVCNKCARDFSFQHKEIQTHLSYSADTNGYHFISNQSQNARTAHVPPYHSHILPPGVHRPRLNSTETEI